MKNMYEGFPLVIAGNRDELLDRPSEVPRIRDNGILAPKDLQRHGTWTGVNNQGIFVGLTNRMDIKSQPGKLSRGMLVMDLLGCRTMVQVEEYVSQLKGPDYNGFNLIVADRNKLFVVRGDGQRITSISSDGLVIISNHGVRFFNDGGGPAPQRVQNILRAWDEDKLLHKTPDTSALRTLLDIHDTWRHGTCINEPENNYGTKSSHIIRLKASKHSWEYWHRERSGDKHICSDAFLRHFQFPVEYPEMSS